MTVTSSAVSCDSKFPIIVLRKGKIELKVRNAAAIIQRINEKFPKERNYLKDNVDNIGNENRQWAKSAKEWFSKEVFGGVGDFEVFVDNGDTGFSSVDEKFSTCESAMFDENVEKVKAQIDDIQRRANEVPEKSVMTVNKNAYEIRLNVLENAIHWLSMDVNVPKTGEHPDLSPKEFRNGDAVIELANKFYKFVENKK